MGYYERARPAASTTRWPTRSRSATATTARCIGPTDPNRLYSITATIDPAGSHGGPLLETLVAGARRARGELHLDDDARAALRPAGVSWKVYTSPGGGVFDNVLPYFSQLPDDAGAAARRGLKPTYPATSWRTSTHDHCRRSPGSSTSIGESEHPASRRRRSASTAAARRSLDALIAHPTVWEKTALFITWDENGGFFDHVAPPVPPPGRRAST